MEAPIPIDNKIIKSNEFKLTLNNKLYLITLILSNNIRINLLEKELLSSSYNSTNLTLEDFRKINKIFKIYETLEEVYKILEQLFIKNKVNLNIMNDKYYCEFKMNSPTGEDIKILIPLENDKMNQNEINNKLFDEINELKNRIKFLENENSNFIKVIQNLKLKLYILDTKILDKEDEFNFFEKMMKEKFPNKNYKLNLLFRATTDGDVAEFHSKCDNKNNVIVLYQTIKNIKFGGYSSIGFDSSCVWKNDNKSFIFQINKKKIYNAKGDQQIGCYNIIGPSFGGSNPRGVAIHLYDRVPILSNNEKGHRTNKIINTFEGLNQFEINNGEEFFNLKELEVFHINFE